MMTDGMRNTPIYRLIFLWAVALSIFACRRSESRYADHPRIAVDMAVRDVTFHSAALDRDMPYRVILPATVTAGRKLPVVYLLHGGGGEFRDWSNYSDVGRISGRGFILVMPEGASSYYTNAVEQPQDRYEDYIVNDLVSDVEKRFPAAPDRQNRAVVGVSMGGFGAVKLGLRHPELFVFAGGISSALDVPRRAFTVRRLQQSRHYNSIFGPSGSVSRAQNDPFVLVRTVKPEQTPYFFLTCGEQEGLLPANREFASLLAQHHFRYESHTMPGGHNWNQWNSWIPLLFRSLTEHLGDKG